MVKRVTLAGGKADKKSLFVDAKGKKSTLKKKPVQIKATGQGNKPARKRKKG